MPLARELEAARLAASWSATDCPAQLQSAHDLPAAGPRSPFVAAWSLHPTCPHPRLGFAFSPHLADPLATYHRRVLEDQHLALAIVGPYAPSC